jgi:hypothetical protein
MAAQGYPVISSIRRKVTSTLAACVVVSVALVTFTGSVARAEGHHLRFVTPHGPVHVWTPEGYDRDTAAVVVYLHGYYTTVDQAWRTHHLAEQFANAHINGLFIVCATPDKPSRAVAWPSLDGLLAAVARRTKLPDHGRLVVVAHSGGHRTLTSWLNDPAIDTVVLLDALYGEQRAYQKWILAAPAHRMIDIAVNTLPWADSLHAALDETVTHDESDNPGDAAQERIIYIRGTIDHMGIVTGGVMIPWVLRMLQAPLLDADTKVAG